MRRLTSDWHIGHKNIIKYDNRPFTSIEEHDQAIIDTMNKYIKEDDMLEHLGDVLLTNKSYAKGLLEQINCKNITLYSGNHDTKSTKDMLISMGRNPLHSSDSWYNQGELRVVMSHFPNGTFSKGADFHIHGHTHHNREYVPGYVDVGLDFIHVTGPIPYDDLLHYLCTHETTNLLTEVRPSIKDYDGNYNKEELRLCQCKGCIRKL